MYIKHPLYNEEQDISSVTLQTRLKRSNKTPGSEFSINSNNEIYINEIKNKIPEFYTQN